MSDTVYVTSNTHKRYHKEDCDRAPDSNPRDKDMMDSWGYEPCSYCFGTHEPGQASLSGSNSTLEEILDNE